MKLLLTRSNKPISFLIRTFTWSRFSHVAVVMPDCETVIDATFKHGVKEWRTNDFLDNHDYVVVVEVDGDPLKAKELLGKKYDFTGIVGIWLKRKWNNTSRWFCSELAAYCMSVFRQDRRGRITPENIYMVSRGYTIIKQGKKFNKWVTL